MNYGSKVKIFALFLFFLTIAVQYGVTESFRSDLILMLCVVQWLVLFALIPDKREDIPGKLKKLKYPNLFLAAIGYLTASCLVQTPWDTILLGGLAIYTLFIAFLFMKNNIWRL